MKKRFLKRYAAALLILMLCLCLTGCVGNQETVLTIGVYSGSYWNTPNGNCYQILDDVITLFEQAHPGVKVEYVSGIPADDYSEWLSGQILKGTEPDLYFVLPEDFDLLVSSGALAQLDERIAGDPAFDTSAYYEPCLRSGQSEGRQYALPHESVPTIMFVNKTLLEANGIDMPDNDWTWDDFYSICQQITNVDQCQYGVYGYSWLDAMYSNGASLFSEDGRSCYLAEDTVQQAIQFTKRLGELNGGYSVSVRDFDLGRVAFRPLLYSEYRAYQPYPWRVKKYSGFEWDCICMPAGTHGGNTSEQRTMLLGVSSRSRNKELAWEFAKLLSFDETTQQKLYAYSHGISPLRDVAEDDEMLSQLRGDIPGGGSFSRDVVGSIMQTAVIASQFDGYEQALAMAQSAVAQVMNSSDALNSRLLAAQREINIYLSKS